MRLPVKPLPPFAILSIAPKIAFAVPPCPLPPKILIFVPPQPPSSGKPAKQFPRALLNPGTETLGFIKSNTPREPVAAAMS